jgi:ribosome maturation factor RimP
MNPVNNKIRDIASHSAKRHNLFIVDVVFRGTQHNPVIEVFVDGEDNVSANQCAIISNEIKKILDEEDFYKSYRLDVSSPGVERPLIYIKQFPKHIRRNFEIDYRTADGTKKLSGKLIGIDGEVLTFSDKREIKVKFHDIIKAKVLVSFNQRR